MWGSAVEMVSSFRPGLVDEGCIAVEAFGERHPLTGQAGRGTSFLRQVIQGRGQFLIFYEKRKRKSVTFPTNLLLASPQLEYFLAAWNC